jgi:hypothetical protein
MPGLIRGVARTAVVAGTASAVSGRVQRRQAERFAELDAEIAARRARASEQQALAPAQPVPPAAPAEHDVVVELKALAELRNQGILTEDEFAAQKARVLR